MLGDLPVRGAVARGRAGGHVQDPFGDAVREAQRAGQALGRPAALDQRVLRGRGDLQLGGVPPPGVELLARRRGEAHRERQLTGCHRGPLALHLGGTLVHGLRLLGHGHAHEAVRVGLHDHQHGLLV